MPIYNPPAGGSGATITFGTATIDFGSFPGTSEASIAVTGQASIGATSKVWTYINADDTTADHTANDHRYLPTFVDFSHDTPTAGVGFTIHGRCLDKMQGTWKVRWAWAD